MIKKMVSIIIISLLVLIGLPYNTMASIDNITPSEEATVSYIAKKTEPNNSISNTFDMYMDCIAWLSPYEKNEEKSLLCLNILIDYVGDYDITNDYTRLTKVYAIYPDGSDILVKSYNDDFGSFYTPFLGYMFAMHIEEKPILVRVEFETNHPEENIENNQKTVTVSSGITVHGYANQKDKSGETNPVYTILIINADESHFFDSYSEGRAFPDEDGYYFAYAPYKTGYIYPVEAISNDNGKRMTKYIEAAEESQVYSLDFTFSKNCKPIYQRFTDILDRLLDNHPNLFPILRHLLQLRQRLLQL